MNDVVSRTPSTTTSTLDSVHVTLGDDLDIVVVDAFSVSGRITAVPRPTVSDTPARPVAPRLPSLPAEGPRQTSLSEAKKESLRSRATALVEEARAVARRAAPEGAAPLWCAAGQLHETELDDTTQAAACYEMAYRANPAFLPGLRAARRLFARLGRWHMVALLLEEEARVPRASRAAVLADLAHVLEGPLGRRPEALDVHRRLLAESPAQLSAVGAVVDALMETNHFGEAVDVLVSAVDATTSPANQLVLLEQAASICESRLKDFARAEQLLERALALAPTRRTLLEAKRRVLATSGHKARLASVLDALASTAPTPLAAAALYKERARVLLDSLSTARSDDDDREPAAIASLRNALEREPSDDGAREDLCRLYERRRLWRELADALEVRGELATDPRSRAARWSEAARVAEERLADHERAIRLYRRSAETAPENLEVLSSLGRLFARTHRLEDLSMVYDQQLQGLADPVQRLPLLFKHAELLAHALDDGAGALVRLREILSVTPNDVAAAQMAAMLYAKQGRFLELVELWEAQLADPRMAHDAPFRLSLLNKMADVYEDRLDDLATAAATYERLLKIEPRHLPALRELSRLYISLGRFEDALVVHGVEAESVEDPNVIVALWFRNAEILANKLGRVDDAVGVLHRALAVMPTYLPALKLLGSIYARTGRWRELVAMHRSEAGAVASRPQRAHLFFQAATLLLEQVGDVDAAVAAFHDVLSEDPSHAAALHGLERIARQRGDGAALLASHERAFAAASDTRVRSQLRCRMAVDLERSLSRADDAVALLESVVADDPSFVFGHEHLIALLTRLGRCVAEYSARERAHAHWVDDAQRLENLRTMLALARGPLADQERAADTAQRLLAVDANDREALQTILAVARTKGDFSLALQTAERLAATETSPEEVCRLHTQMASWREFHIEPPTSPLSDWLRVLEFQPDHPIAARAVERCYLDAGAFDALFSLYELQAPFLVDPDLIVDNAMKRGELAEDRLGKPEVARACYERALSAVRDHLPAITRLKELYGREGRPQDQLRLTTLEAETSKDPGHAIRTLLQAGLLHRDQFRDLDAASDCFARVLDRDPHHPEAYAAAEAILVQQERYEALAGLYEKTAKAIEGASSSSTRQAELLTKAARVFAERLADPARALPLLERVAALLPEDAQTMAFLGAVRTALGSWDEAIAAFQSYLARSAHDAGASSVHLQLGTIFLRHRPDGPAAVRHLSTALASAPSSRPTLSLLAHAHELAGDLALARRTWADLAHSGRDETERREIQRTLARLCEQMGDDAAAAGYIEAVAQETSDVDEARALYERVTRLYERADDVSGMVASTMRRAESVASTDAPRAATLFLRLARLQGERLKNIDAALQSTQRALELAPDFVEARAFRADLYGQIPNQHLLAVEEHRRVFRAGRLRVDSLHGLYRAWLQQRAPDRAMCAAEALSFLSASSEQEEAFLQEHKKRLKKDSRDHLESEQVTSWVAHPAQRNAVRDVLSLCAVDLGRVLAHDAPEELEKRFVLKPRAEDSLRTLCDQLAHNLGTTGFDVWRSQVKRSGVEVYANNPVIVHVGLDLTRTHPAREQRFLLGRKLMGLQSGHHLLRGMDARGLAGLLTAIGRSQEKLFPAIGGAEAIDVDGLAKKVGGALSRKTRNALGEPLAQLAASPKAIDLDAFLRACPLSENRGGLLLGGALDVAVRLVARDNGVSLTGSSALLLEKIEGTPALLDLFIFSLSDEFFQARQVLKFAVDS